MSGLTGVRRAGALLTVLGPLVVIRGRPMRRRKALGKIAPQLSLLPRQAQSLQPCCLSIQRRWKPSRSPPLPMLGSSLAMFLARAEHEKACLQQ